MKAKIIHLITLLIYAVYIIYFQRSIPQDTKKRVAMKQANCNKMPDITGDGGGATITLKPQHNLAGKTKC